jgi:2-haloacid dehalogenase
MAGLGPRLATIEDTIRDHDVIQRQHLAAENMAKHGGLPWDCILSAENVRHYKPDAEVYLLVPQLFDLAPDQVMMVAAHEHDLQSAQKYGLHTAFIHRPLERGAGKAAAVPPTDRYDFVATDMLELAKQLGV